MGCSLAKGAGGRPAPVKADGLLPQFGQGDLERPLVLAAAGPLGVEGGVGAVADPRLNRGVQVVDGAVRLGQAEAVAADRLDQVLRAVDEQDAGLALRLA